MVKERRGQETDEGKWKRGPDAGNSDSLMFLFKLRSKNTRGSREAENLRKCKRQPEGPRKAQGVRNDV